MSFILLTVRFLDDRYHGLLDRGGPPEWPPSPFRLFQALVAGVARRGELVIGIDTAANTNFTDTGKAIGWLQELAPPIIIAPKSRTGQAITRFVPNNDGDKKFDRQERLTAKATIPTLFLLDPDQKPEVHYVWDIGSQSDVPVERIRDAARSLTTLGWGIDMAFADARPAPQAEVESLPGVRWHPKPGAWRDEGMLRTPTLDEETQQCSMCDLRHCHETAMNRIQHGKPLRTVDKPKVFGQVLYTSSERLIDRPAIVFQLLDDDGEFIKPPYLQSKLIHIAGMVRHLAIKAMQKSPPAGVADDWVESYVAGHVRPGAEGHRQFSYLPLPSIGHVHTAPSIRRVMIVAPLGDDRLLEHLARARSEIHSTRECLTKNCWRAVEDRSLGRSARCPDSDGQPFLTLCG
ncbi:MAG: type I-U CRISPR-associated protein Csb2 [Planctomycetaceae bacterium]